jgi:hypothetical protein
MMNAYVVVLAAVAVCYPVSTRGDTSDASYGYVIQDERTVCLKSGEALLHIHFDLPARPSRIIRTASTRQAINCAKHNFTDIADLADCRLIGSYLAQVEEIVEDVQTRAKHKLNGIYDLLGDTVTMAQTALDRRMRQPRNIIQNWLGSVSSAIFGVESSQHAKTTRLAVEAIARNQGRLVHAFHNETNQLYAVLNVTGQRMNSLHQAIYENHDISVRAMRVMLRLKRQEENTERTLVEIVKLISVVTRTEEEMASLDAIIANLVKRRLDSRLISPVQLDAQLKGLTRAIGRQTNGQSKIMF